MFLSRTERTDSRQVQWCIRLLFCVYLFLYLNGVADTSYVLAHWELAHGLTTYIPFIGAVVLTVIYMGIQWLVARLFHFPKGYYVLTCVPSALVCVLLPAFFMADDFISTFVVSGIIFLYWLVMAVKGAKPEYGSNLKEKSYTPYTHALLFFLLAVYMGVFGPVSDFRRYEVSMTDRVFEGDYKGALSVGEGSQVTTPRMTALRAFCLAKTNEGLGEKLFSFFMPEGGSDNLLLESLDGPGLAEVEDSISFLLKRKRAVNGINTLAFLRRAAERNPQGSARDYYLCGLLLDKRLPDFAREISRFYVVSDSVELPCHYGEAMVLYGRLYPAETPLYVDPSKAEDYLNFREKGKKMSEKERAASLWREYGNKYWWYYFYGPEPIRNEQ